MGPATGSEAWFDALTPGEQRVASVVGRGVATKQAALELGVSVKTIEFHLGNVFRKLGLTSRSELANLVGRTADRESRPRAVGFGQLELGGREMAVGALPVNIDKFIGRVATLTRLREMIPSSRLVTLHGVGGVGKTRLAAEVAHLLAAEYADGCWFIDLASLSDPAAVMRAVAEALNIRLPAVGSVADRVTSVLARRHVLLIFDNCEHLLDPIADAIGLLVRTCPTVTVVATSRHPIRVAGERLFPVSALTSAEAHELFAARARAEAPDVPVEADSTIVAALCERLDRLPLAIELAAARLRTLSPGEIVDQLDERFRILSGGWRARADRQQTMRNALDWSYNLSSTHQQTVFDALSVFPAAFDLAAADEVTGHLVAGAADIVDVLGHLVDQSLLQRTIHPDGTSRYRFLETMRAYASEHLERSPVQATVRARHAHHTAIKMASLAINTFGPDEHAIRGRISETLMDARLALEWFIEHRDWDGAFDAAVTGAIPDARADRELTGRLYHAIIAADVDPPPDYLDQLEIVVRLDLTQHERAHRAWMVLDRRPVWSAGRYELIPYGQLAVDHTPERSVDDLLATLDLVAHLGFASRFVAEFFAIWYTTNVEPDRMESELRRFEPGWIASGSAAGRWAPPLLRGNRAFAQRKWREAVKSYDAAFSVEPLEQWHPALLIAVDNRLTSRVHAHQPITRSDLLDPWLVREHTGAMWHEAAAALATAHALDRLQSTELSEHFLRKAHTLSTTDENNAFRARSQIRMPKPRPSNEPLPEHHELLADLRSIADGLD